MSVNQKEQSIHHATTRRRFLYALATSAFVTGFKLVLPLPAWGRSQAEGIKHIKADNLFNLTLGYVPLEINGVMGKATAINGTVPGPLLRWKEGDFVKINVTNNLQDTEHTSIHWHGILVPFRMDGVPGINFKGIRPGETYEYSFEVKQAGTYWYHSHSAFQEQTGSYGPLIIDPKEKEPFDFDREHVVVLSDWTFEDPSTVFRNLHKLEGYYNYQKRTVSDLMHNMQKKGTSKALQSWLAWDKMRMSPVDLLDVTGATYTYLMNGSSPDMNWTGLFNPGEVVRLRFINASAMSNLDIRIPGLDMEVVMADGKAVQPVKVHEFRIGVAETYDVLVRPTKDGAYTIFAEALDRSGYSRGTLASKAGMEAPIPKMRSRPVRTMKNIGMGMMDKKKHESITTPGTPSTNGPTPFKPSKMNVNVAMVISNPKNRLDEPGIGLGSDGWKVLTYKDLKSIESQPYSAQVDREMTIDITSNMERFMFSFDGMKFTDQPGPYLFHHNERLRLFLVNHTMMEHPIHLHGMWMQLENGHSHDQIPFKHTILVKPGEKLSVLITPIEKGDWAFHCHLLYHMEAGMFQVVRVT